MVTIMSQHAIMSLGGIKDGNSSNMVNWSLMRKLIETNFLNEYESSELRDFLIDKRGILVVIEKGMILSALKLVWV